MLINNHSVMSDRCSVHSLPWRTVPAGVSAATNKPYQSFQACPERGCKERPPKPEAVAASGMLEEMKKQTELLVKIEEALTIISINSVGNPTPVNYDKYPTASSSKIKPASKPDEGLDEIPF